jgi:hypothetical protein
LCSLALDRSEVDFLQQADQSFAFSGTQAGRRIAF